MAREMRLAIIATAITVLTGCGDSDVNDQIKALWYEHNMLLKDEFAVEVKPQDINNDGQIDWFTTSSYNCGSQGCTYELWSKVDNEVCMVGKWSSDIRKLEVEGELQCNQNIFLDIEGYNNTQEAPRTNKGGEVDIVKAGVMDFNQTITVGKALDNWQSCKDTNWKSFETKNGITVVEFTCQFNLELILGNQRLHPKLAKDYKKTLINSGTQTFQFTLNQDRSFQIDNVQITLSYNNNKVRNFPYEDLTKALEMVYQDKILTILRWSDHM